MIDASNAVERIATVTADTFPELVLGGSGAIVVEFMSYGCAHCRALEPVLQHVASMLGEQTFYRVNTAVDTGLANSYGIRGTPTLVLFRDAQEIARIEGPSPSITSLLRAVTHPFST